MTQTKQLMPLLIAPKQRTNPIFPPIGYSLGWLFQDNNNARWMVWGNSQNKEAALKVVQEVLSKSGPREVLVWDEPLPRDLSIVQLDQIRNHQLGG